mmetsp:Transcript_36113/g.64280  ORF Transcript_36113/g.64280 Transcript_36113/m.64280 type:complete len:248 (+) Transcript_36113:3-746(+)
MDGSDGEPDYRLSMSSTRKCGTFHRDENCTSLVMGTTEQPGEGKFKNATDRSLQFFKQFSGLTIISGINNVQDFFNDKFNHCGTIALRDYFQYWKSKDMTGDGGKPFFFDPSGRTNRHEIFFDDNIRFDEFHIVQPINIERPTKKHWVSQMLQTHLVRSEPWDAIYDRQYFIKNLARLEAGYEGTLKARERLKALMKNVMKSKAIVKAFNSSAQEPLKEYDAWKNLRVSDAMLPLKADDDDQVQRNF